MKIYLHALARGQGFEGMGSREKVAAVEEDHEVAAEQDRAKDCRQELAVPNWGCSPHVAVVEQRGQDREECRIY